MPHPMIRAVELIKKAATKQQINDQEFFVLCMARIQLLDKMPDGLREEFRKSLLGISQNEDLRTSHCLDIAEDFIAASIATTCALIDSIVEQDGLNISQADKELTALQLCDYLEKILKEVMEEHMKLGKVRLMEAIRVVKPQP